MEKGFNFEKIGKKMPYTIPEDSFERMENRVFEAVNRGRTPLFGGFFRKAAFRWTAVTAALAALALAFSLRATVFAPDSYSDLLAAFDALDSEDQQFVLEYIDFENL